MAHTQRTVFACVRIPGQSPAVATAYLAFLDLWALRIFLDWIGLRAFTQYLSTWYCLLRMP